MHFRNVSENKFRLLAFCDGYRKSLSVLRRPAAAGNGHKVRPDGFICIETLCAKREEPPFAGLPAECHEKTSGRPDVFKDQKVKILLPGKNLKNGGDKKRLFFLLVYRSGSARQTCQDHGRRLCSFRITGQT